MSCLHGHLSVVFGSVVLSSIVGVGVDVGVVSGNSVAVGVGHTQSVCKTP